jgi:hypothetical protein
MGNGNLWLGGISNYFYCKERRHPSQESGYPLYQSTRMGSGA